MAPIEGFLLSQWYNAIPPLLLLIAYILLSRRFFSPLADIPGPFWASLGRLWHSKHAISGDQNVAVTKLHEKHGHFVRIADNEVSITHPDAIKKVFLGPMKKEAWYSFFALAGPSYQSPFSTIDPARKAELTRNYAAGFSLSNILRNEEAMNDTVGLLLDRLNGLCGKAEPVDLDKWIDFCSFDLLGEAMFSKPFGYLREGRDVGKSIENNKFLSMLSACAAHHGFMRLLGRLFLGNPLISRTGILPMGHLANTCMRNLAEREGNDDSRFDMVAHWYRSFRQHPDRISLVDYHAQVISVLGAGGDTVACALQSFVYHMVRAPGLWKRAQNEIDAARGNGLCGDRVVSYTDAIQLPFTAACIKEALRIHPPVPWNLPRVGKNEVKVGEKTFPAGVTLSVNPWAIHHSKEIWGENAHEFSPDRWLDTDSGKMERYFLPFGAGSYMCPGQSLARVELAKVTATLVRDYNIQMVDPQHSWEWKAYFTMVPQNWPVYLQKRET
ncbi:putative Cytochrome P450 [Seiridium cardinale]